MNLTRWLEALAASYPNFQMTKLQAFEYKQEFDSWTMTDEQWLDLKSLVRRRHTFFPSIAELEEIRDEIRRGILAVSKPPTGPVWETWLDDDGKWQARRPQNWNGKGIGQ
jgi:hypothetical protein